MTLIILNGLVQGRDSADREDFQFPVDDAYNILMAEYRRRSDNSSPDKAVVEVRDLLAQDDYLGAIKYIQSVRGFYLREAKEFVDDVRSKM